jgi:hypothetical protein
VAGDKTKAEAQSSLAANASAGHFDVVKAQQRVAVVLLKRLIESQSCRAASAAAAAADTSAAAAAQGRLPVERRAVAPLARSQRQRVVNMRGVLQLLHGG